MMIVGVWVPSAHTTGTRSLYIRYLATTPLLSHRCPLEKFNDSLTMADLREKISAGVCNLKENHELIIQKIILQWVVVSKNTDGLLNTNIGEADVKLASPEGSDQCTMLNVINNASLFIDVTLETHYMISVIALLEQQQKRTA